MLIPRPKGAPLRRSNFTREWRKSTASAGMHFHDFSLRELMDRMGNSSMRAALIYQHRSTHLVAGVMGR